MSRIIQYLLLCGISFLFVIILVAFAGVQGFLFDFLIDKFFDILM